MDPISASFAAAAGKALSSSGDAAGSGGGGAKWLERVLVVRNHLRDAIAVGVSNSNRNREVASSPISHE